MTSSQTNLTWRNKNGKLYGGTGNDVLVGGTGSDELYGYNGDEGIQTARLSKRSKKTTLVITQNMVKLRNKTNLFKGNKP